MIDDKTLGAPWCSVPTAELDAGSVRVAISPLLTVLALTRDALQGGRRHTPVAWRNMALSELRGRDAETLAPLTNPETTGWPTVLDDIGASRETLGDALGRVSAISGTSLIEALDTDRDVTSTAAWDEVRREPDRWLRRYVEALGRAGGGLASLWWRSVDMLEREAERIGAATDRGVSASQIVNEVNTPSSVAGDMVRLAPGPEPRRLGVGDDGLILAPMVTGHSAGAIATPGDDIAWIGYALIGAWRALDASAPPAGSLQSLLGVYRTALLRRLDTPQTAGDLAQMIDLTPGAVTFHLRALETSGLIVRERRGRNVIVRRTTRGTQLLALYDMA